MDVSIDETLKGLVPGLALGCVRASVVVEKNRPDLWAEIDAHVRTLSSKLSPESIVEITPVKAARDAYKAIGKDPSRYRGSAEALLRRVAGGKGLYRINNVVDVNNLVSLSTMLPVGSYDFDRLIPPVVFRIGLSGESYKGIGKDVINIADLPVFADNEGPFGSPTSDSERAMIRPETQGLLMVVISFSGQSALPSATEQAATLLERYATARNVRTTIVQ